MVINREACKVFFQNHNFGLIHHIGMIKKVMDWIKPMVFEKCINKTSFNGKTSLEVNEKLAFQ
jgi:hypothetical protein